jgi:rubredoxin
MKYQCEHCDFLWEGTLHTFDKVRDHEKTHLENKTIRCKVCNTSKNIVKVKNNSDEKWECQNCGNILDVNGLISSQ